MSFVVVTALSVRMSASVGLSVLRSRSRLNSQTQQQGKLGNHFRKRRAAFLTERVSRSWFAPAKHGDDFEGSLWIWLSDDQHRVSTLHARATGLCRVPRTSCAYKWANRGASSQAKGSEIVQLRLRCGDWATIPPLVGQRQLAYQQVDGGGI